MNIDWNELVSLEEWISISRLDISFEELDESLLKISMNKYFVTSPFRGNCLEEMEGGPFLTALLWACSDGAALRAYNMMIERDDMVTAMPPPILLPAEDANTYSAILICLKKKNLKSVIESATYRIISDGSFVHRSIECDLASYYFRSSEHDDQEEPYAILWKLNGLWTTEA
jgi:hypothetical protein